MGIGVQMDVKMKHWFMVIKFEKSLVIDDSYILKKLFSINRENKFPGLYKILHLNILIIQNTLILILYHFLEFLLKLKVYRPKLFRNNLKSNV